MENTEDHPIAIERLGARLGSRHDPLFIIGYVMESPNVHEPTKNLVACITVLRPGDRRRHGFTNGDERPLRSIAQLDEAHALFHLFQAAVVARPDTVDVGEPNRSWLVLR